MPTPTPESYNTEQRTAWSTRLVTFNNLADTFSNLEPTARFDLDQVYILLEVVEVHEQMIEAIHEILETVTLNGAVDVSASSLHRIFDHAARNAFTILHPEVIVVSKRPVFTGENRERLLALQRQTENRLRKKDSRLRSV